MIAKHLLLAALLAGMAGLCGCAGMFALGEKLWPKDRVPPKFTLPAQRKILVLPDDVDRPVGYPPVKAALANRCNKLLMEQKLAAQVIDYSQVQNLAASRKDFNQLAISSIAEKLGADLVIYVNIEQFALKDDPMETIWHGRMSVKVRVVDVLAKSTESATIWPEEHAGYPLGVSEPAADNSSETFGQQLANTLANRLGEQVVGLFYEHWVERNRLPDQPNGSSFD
jgi:hypothetical protein